MFTAETGKLLVIDDCLTDPKQSRCLGELFNVISHHQNISVILSIQNLFFCTQVQRAAVNTLLRSCSYVTLFVNRRQTPVITQLARTYFPGEQHKLIEPFKCMLKKCEPYKYIFIDLETDEEQYQVREGGLLPKDKCFIYHEEN